MVVLGLRDVVNDNLPLKVLHVIMMMMVVIVIVWAKGHRRRAAQTSTCAAPTGTASAAVRNGRSCRSQGENEYHTCKRSHLAFPLIKGGNVGQIHL